MEPNPTGEIHAFLVNNIEDSNINRSCQPEFLDPSPSSLHVCSYLECSSTHLLLLVVSNVSVWLAPHQMDAAEGSDHLSIRLPPATSSSKGVRRGKNSEASLPASRVEAIASRVGLASVELTNAARDPIREFLTSLSFAAHNSEKRLWCNISATS